MSFESDVRGVLYQRWRKFLRFAQDDKRQRAQNNQTLDAQQFATAATETLNPKSESFFDAEFLKKLERLRASLIPKSLQPRVLRLPEIPTR